ncbi:hotdog domain-containing protein [uncultured Campylobacter sp.]|uniref:hotdog domain-containing protein n=1 Tax=uncultured Campylobacter sp. TaxID=218934 RepID=UPI002628F061|nr:hotdog domain-containing protein [uncultured Campylobacter sp.]
MKIRIYYEDTDAGGIAYHANYIKYCERARSEMFFGSEVKPLARWAFFIVSEIRAKFKKPIVLGNLLETKVKTVELKKMSAIVK